MPRKKRPARTVPKPTIMVEPNLPLDLPTPTTTRNRQPRAQTTFSARTARQSTLRSEGKLFSTSHTQSAMQRPASSGTHEGFFKQDATDSQDSENNEQHQAGSSSQERTGHTTLVEDSRSGSIGPSSSGYPTPLSDTSERAEYSYQNELDGEAPGQPGSSLSYADASAQDQHPSAAASSSYTFVGKRKRPPSELLDEDTHEPPASQESVQKVDKGKGKARAAPQNVHENVMEISEPAVKPHIPSSSQDLPEGSPSSSYTNKGKGKARATSAVDDPNVLEISDSPVKPRPPSPAPKRGTQPTSEPLSSYTCPICFGPPTNATLTPCGHICCGACLFAAVKTTMSRASWSGPIVPGGGPEARCPVCRAIIPNWDGKGRGVIGLQIRTTINI